MTLHVDSEVGRLRQAILHRPDLELKRLTPTNHDEYLFDDVLWVKHAKQEHDAFAETLRDQGVVGPPARPAAHPDRWLIPDARKYVLEESLDERVYGPMALDSLHDAFSAMDDAELTTYLIGGMTKRELLERVPEPPSVVVQALGLDDLLLPPLPNHLFTRDTSAWIYDGVSINSMRKRARDARDDPLRGDLPLAPALRRRAVPASGPRAPPTARPPPRAATSSSWGGAPSWWG